MKIIFNHGDSVDWEKISDEDVRNLVKSGIASETLVVRRGAKPRQLIFVVESETIVADIKRDVEILRSLEREFPELAGILL
jgi:hypothetical protein